jgi:hypothetical protein
MVNQKQKLELTWIGKENRSKLEGFTYAPSDSMYWQQGRSTERDFIYVTTANLSHDQLQQLYD